jgi:hypothetical protein
MAEASRAYITEGRDTGDRQTLLDVVAEAGLDPGLGRQVCPERFRRRPAQEEHRHPQNIAWSAAAFFSTTR